MAPHLAEILPVSSSDHYWRSDGMNRVDFSDLEVNEYDLSEMLLHDVVALQDVSQISPHSFFTRFTYLLMKVDGIPLMNGQYKTGNTAKLQRVMIELGEG